MALRVRKIGGIEELNAFLRGGIIGGADIRRGVYGLDGLTLVFSAPAATVTFATVPPSTQIALSAKEILTQIEAVVALAGFGTFEREGKLRFEDPAAAVAVVLASGTALSKLGFNSDIFARGSIAAVAGSALVDGEDFDLDDGTNPAVTFEFDDNASVVETPTLRAVAFTGADSLDTVSAAILAAIAGAPVLAITPSVGSPGLTNLVNNAPGVAGNVAITESVVDAGFIVTGMEGGLASAAAGVLYNAPGGGAPALVAVDLTSLGASTYLVVTDE